jgi:predicted dehydrogenase
MSVARWGLIGAGDIVRKRVAPALRDLPNCELVSIARANAGLAAEFAKEFGASKWFDDYRELVADPEIHAVYIATPVFLHAEQAIAAAESGKHVLCEKPMALNVEECDRMIDACRSNNVKLGIAYYRRFYPVLDRIKELISDDAIGKVSVAQINAFEYVDLDSGDPRHWFIEKAKSGGGPMIDFGCHRLEVLTNLFGSVEKVTSLVSNRVFGREVEDTAVASMQFENGTCASVTVTHAAREPQDTLDIYGTEGSIHVPVLNNGQMTVRVGGTIRDVSLPPDANIHAPLIEQFADCILRNASPEVTGECGREIASLIEKIYAEVLPERR